MEGSRFDSPEPNVSSDPALHPDICLRCGKELRQGVSFCSHCGWKVGTDPQAPIPHKPTPLEVIREINRGTHLVNNIIIFFCLWIATSVIGSIIYRASGKPISILFFIEIFNAVLTIFWMLVFHRQLIKIYSLPNLFCGYPKYVIALLGGISLFLMVHFIVVFLNTNFGLDNYVYSDKFYEAGYGSFTILLSICFQPAIIEELAFRGIIQTALKNYMGRTEAIIVTSAAFAIMHFSIISFVHLFIIGMYLGWLREWSKSLYPSMLVHFIHNLLVTLQEANRFLPE